MKARRSPLQPIRFLDPTSTIAGLDVQQPRPEPRYEALTVALAYSRDRDETTGRALQDEAALVGEATHMAELSHADTDNESDSGLAYSDVQPFDVTDQPASENEAGRKPFLLVGSVLAGTFVVGVVSLLFSLVISTGPTAYQRPNPGESMTVSDQAPVATAVPEAQFPPAPPPETIQAPAPVVQQTPRTVFVQPPQAPAPVPPAASPPEVQTPDGPAPPPIIAPPIIAPPVVKQPRLWLPRVFEPRAHHHGPSE